MTRFASLTSRCLVVACALLAAHGSIAARTFAQTTADNEPSEGPRRSRRDLARETDDNPPRPTSPRTSRPARSVLTDRTFANEGESLPAPREFSARDSNSLGIPHQHFIRESTSDQYVDDPTAACDSPECAPRGPFPSGWFRHAGRGDPGRHIGWGEPLEGTSWLNRPWHVDFFAGGLFADELIKNRVDQRDGFFSGVRIGYDFDHYWGWELRYQQATVPIEIATAGAAPSAFDYMVDVHLNYYPWGDSAWRPYGSLGLGLAGFHFTDNLNRQIDQTLVEIPFGVGVKYFLAKNWTLRLDLTDHFALGGADLKTMNNVALTGGMEFHFGATPTGYYPWNPSNHLW